MTPSIQCAEADRAHIDADLWSACLDAVYRSISVGILVCETKGCVIASNHAARAMLGFSEDEVRAERWTELIKPSNDEQGARLQELVSGSCESYQAEGTLLVRNGFRPWCRSTAQLIQGPNHRRLILVTVEDLSVLKAAEERLHETQKLESIGRLVGSVAHDFNNLLTGIVLYSDLLVANKQVGDDTRLHASTIRAAADHGAALVKQLLTLARKQVVEPQILSLNEVIESMSDLLKRLAGERIQLKLELESGLWSVLLDATQVQQIILNLILNARDAMPQGGDIVVVTKNCLPTTSKQPNCRRIVSLSVSDSGYGMDEQTRAQLFRPFFTTKTPGKGNGLGLATIHRIVQDAGGAILVESELGKGTRIEIALPGVLEETDRHTSIDQAASVGNSRSSSEGFSLAGALPTSIATNQDPSRGEN
ncbi:MAG TPA: ATP-binding protein [Terriglobales bacterium]|jgi:PAS domain S-box-containing protein|nr:ATP-binding protein [Terriglobales bacterium]